MNITFGSNISRCVKNFTRLPIVQMHTGSDSRFFVFDKKNTLIGAFNFDESGILSDLSLSRSVRGKKTAANAILSIKDFLINRAKEMKLKSIGFSIEVPYRKVSALRNLCRKFDLREVKETSTSRILHYIKDFHPQKELEALSEIKPTLSVVG